MDWPHAAAILAHDGELASAGITTVFDALRVGSILSGTGSYYGPYALKLAEEINALAAAHETRISHFIHLRAEICSETMAEELAAFGDDHRVRLASLMDHTPGYRQFRDLSKLKEYEQGKYGLSNLIRGGSHSGNVAAEDLARRGLLDIISSDYIPSSLLLSAVRLATIWDDIPRAFATVTATPAAATGLADRGRIAAGLRAELVRISGLDGTPRIRGVWCRGRQVG